MPKIGSKYKRYKYDESCLLPRSTRYYQKKKDEISKVEIPKNESVCLINSSSCVAEVNINKF